MLLNVLYFLKETLPPNKNAAFKGYHLPFIGYTYTENCLLNDCHSLIDLISKTDIECKKSVEVVDGKVVNCNEEVFIATETKIEIEQLKSEKLELLEKIKAFQNGLVLKIEQNIENSESSAGTSDEIKTKLDQSQLMVENLKDQLLNSTNKLNEMTNLYETSKQNELEEKSKTKHLERSVRALKIEKDQLFTQIYDLQERTNLQAKDLQEAQNQRKLAVQEFTDVNEKVNELRSKNNKLSNELLNKEDEIDDLKRACHEAKVESDKRDKITDDFKSQIATLNDSIKILENEKSDALQKLLNE